MKRRGFTWIELVVVLAIVLIIAAILFPIFARQRENDGRPRSCASGVRQIALGIRQYTQDNDELFPPVNCTGSVYGWVDACQPYIKSVQLFQCPGEPTSPVSGPTVVGYSDYFYNSRLEDQNESRLLYNSSTTVMLGDAVPGDARQHSTGGTSKVPGVASLVNRAGAPVGAAMRHLDGANYGFADGHVKWLRGKDANTSPAIQNAASGLNSRNVGFAVE